MTALDWLDQELTLLALRRTAELGLAKRPGYTVADLRLVARNFDPFQTALAVAAPGERGDITTDLSGVARFGGIRLEFNSNDEADVIELREIVATTKIAPAAP